VSKFLSEEFVAQWATTQRPKLGNSSGMIVAKIEGAPDGKIAVTVLLEDGLITEAYLGSGRGRDLELTIPHELAIDLFRHSADPAAEYMKGRLKMNGDMALWLEVLPAWRSRVIDNKEPELASHTEF
tara:strand:+ start:402 stop:782 length:381 start_codon:yes stop_codon:yes gene_type:complete